MSVGTVKRALALPSGSFKTKYGTVVVEDLALLGRLAETELMVVVDVVAMPLYRFVHTIPLVFFESWL